jgi:uroporphyrinogen-III decarboxylase
MSRERGLQALHLEMPDRVPETEYVSNPKLIERITGLDPENPDTHVAAHRAFWRIMDWDIVWRTDSPPFPKAPEAWMGSARYSETQVLKPATHPFKTEEEVLAYDPAAEIGIPDKAETREMIERNVQATKEAMPGVVVPTGYYNTVFTWCIKSFGWDLFMASAMADPERFDRVVEGFFQLSKPIFEAAAEARDMDCFICHDDIVWTAGPVFRPEWYRKYIFPRMKKLWAPLREAGIPILFCSDGNFTAFVHDLVDCGANGFIFEPLTDLDLIAECYGKTHVIIGNADCRILTFGTKDEITAEVKRCMDIGKKLPGFFMAVGNHIPYNVPVENALHYFECVKEMGRR